MRLPLRPLALLILTACGSPGRDLDPAAGGGRDRLPAAGPPWASPGPTPAAPAGPSPGSPGGPSAAAPGDVPAADGWTTLPVDVEKPTEGAAVLVDARTAAHPGFDRLVLEFAPPGLPGYHVGYVERPFHQCGSGFPIEVEGDGWLFIRLYLAAAHDEAGAITVDERASRPGLPTLIETRLVCDFEGYVEWLVGARVEAPYRVTEMADPPRLVIDLRAAP